MFIVDAGDKTKWNNLSQKNNWLDKNNILLYVSHNTFKISWVLLTFWNTNRCKQLSSLNNNSGKITTFWNELSYGQ